MKKFKSIIILALTMFMALSLVGCGDTTTEEPSGDEQGKVLNIWAWNEEFKGLFENYFVDAGLLPDDVEVKFTIVPSDDNAYQNALDEALQS